MEWTGIVTAGIGVLGTLGGSITTAVLSSKSEARRQREAAKAQEIEREHAEAEALRLRRVDLGTQLMDLLSKAHKRVRVPMAANVPLEVPREIWLRDYEADFLRTRLAVDHQAIREALRDVSFGIVRAGDIAHAYGPYNGEDGETQATATEGTALFVLSTGLEIAACLVHGSELTEELQKQCARWHDEAYKGAHAPW